MTDYVRIGGTTIVAIPNRDGVLVVGDKLGFGRGGASVNDSTKVCIARSDVTLAVWGTGLLRNGRGEKALVILDFLSAFFKGRERVDAADIAAAEDAYRQWFTGWCTANHWPEATKDDPDLPDGYWANVLMLAQRGATIEGVQLDFFYRGKDAENALEMKIASIDCQKLQSTVPQVYGVYPAQELVSHLVNRAKAGKATDVEKHLLLCLGNRWTLDALDVNRALGFAKWIILYSHENVIDQNDEPSVGDTVDAILMPWRGDTIIQARNESARS